VLQAALARETSQIGLRAGSVVMPLHDPIRVAEEWAMVDNLSGGRVGISFASGWHPNDFAFFPENYEQRHAVMYRGIETVRKLWRGESIQVKSGTGELVDLRTYPTPIQPELPFWVTAAGNPKTFAGAGETGAHLLTHLFNQSIEQLAEKIQIYRDARAKQGYDPATGLVSLMLHTFVGEDIDVVREQVRGPFSSYLKSGSYLVDAIAYSRGQKIDMSSLSEQDFNDYFNFVFDRLISEGRVLFGTPESSVEMITKLKAAGVDEITCQLDFGIDLQLALDSLPALNRLRELSASRLATSPGTHSALPGTSYELSSQVVAQYANGHIPVQIQKIPETPAITEPLARLAAIQQRCREQVSLPDFYHGLAERGIQLGTSFQGIEQLWRRDGEALGQIRLSATFARGAAAYQVHPALLDACLQVLVAALPDVVRNSDDALYLPIGLGSFQMHKQPGEHVWSHAQLSTEIYSAASSFEGNVRILDEDGQLLIEVQGLQLQRSELTASPAAPDVLKDWLYELRWEPTTLAQQTATQQPGTWLIFSDKRGIGQRLIELLQARGDQVVSAVADNAYAKVSPERYTVNPADASDMQRLMTEIAETATLPWRGAVHLWSLDATPLEQTSATSLQVDQTLGSGSALLLMQALQQLRINKLPRLWLVTSGAQPVGDDTSSLALAQAPIWGLGKTCAMEQPELWGGLVDTDPTNSSDTTAAQLLMALTAAQTPKEDLLALRQDQTYVARLVRSHDWTPRQLALHADASYLITGGLWGLGLEVARWLVQKGAQHLVLLGRTQLPSRNEWSTVPAASRIAQQIASLRSLEQMGATVHYASVDVADEPQLRTFLQEFARQGQPPIRGVVHAASVWQDAQGQSLVRPLANLDGEALHAVFQPKMIGGWLLHTLLQDAPLDFFVSFSSGASLLGSAAQGNYAAASEFLDMLAYHQRAHGQPAISIDWGAVSETGFGATSDGQRVHEYWESHGIQRITPGQVLAALELLIPQQVARVGVIKLDWQLLREFYAQIATLPLVHYLVAETSDANVPSAAGEAATLQQLQHADQAERQRLMISYLCEQVAGVLRVSADRLDIEQPLTALGLDSLMAIELKNHIERELNVRIPIVTFLQGPSISQFSEQVLEQVAVVADIAETIPHTLAQEQQAEVLAVGGNQVHAEQLLSQLDQLSDTEVDDLLAQMLQQQTSLADATENSVSPQEAQQLLGQLDQLSDDAINSLLGQMVQKED
jgi:natural product biosynthesis luciferase-like monooxygenase protein